MLLMDIKDPRIQFVTITGVELTDDMSIAKVYVSLYGLEKDHEAAWQSYLTLCHESGRVPFKQLTVQSGLKSPFDPGTIASITPALEAYLDGLDKSKIK